PRTRTSRAVQLRAIGDIGSRTSLRTEYRYFWDNWDIRAHTAELGLARHIDDKLIGDMSLRYHTQRHALFYSDNATSETLYVSRNRQLSTFHDYGVGAKLEYTYGRVADGKVELKGILAYEFKRFQYADFTDL